MTSLNKSINLVVILRIQQHEDLKNYLVDHSHFLLMEYTDEHVHRIQFLNKKSQVKTEQNSTHTS
jgi:hypothetical protein